MVRGMNSAKLTLLALVLVSAPFDRSFALTKNSPTRRAKLLATLRRCSPNSRGPVCENATEEAIKRFNRGDEAMLQPLIGLGPNSDAFVAEMLGDFYGKTLWKRPRLFLRAIASHSIKEQREIARHAATMDGGGMPDKMLRDVRSRLRRLAREQDSRLADSARICLQEVEAGNKKGTSQRREIMKCQSEAV
jgi:hypothetical protein